jgi:transcriptional regulator with XRE-family HTH domain
MLLMKKEDLAVLAHQEAVGARLKQVISALGLSAAEAARQMAVSPQRLNGWLSGAHPAPIYHLALFCRLQPVTLDWLVLGESRGLPYDTAVRLGLASAAS